MNPRLAASLVTILGLAQPCLGQQFVIPSRAHLPALDAQTRQVAVGDLDGDGDTDVVMTDWGKPPLLLLNDGTGAFVLSPSMPSVMVTAAELVLADMDGDRDLDLLVADLNGQDRLFLNDGKARFTDVTATSLPVRVASTYAAEVGDVDGDGDRDILFGTGSGNPEVLLLNDGKGRFRDVTTTNLPLLQYYSYSPGVVLADLDGDGDLDCFLSNRFNQNRLYLNSGKGVFGDFSSSISVRSIGGPIAAADVDGDGDLDLVGAFFAGQNALLLNNGRAGFTDATANLPVERDSTSDVDLRDVDGDRDIDIVFSNLSTAQHCKLLLNDGKGKFSTTRELAINEQEAAIADLDGNGTADIVFAGPVSDIYFGDGRGGFAGAGGQALPYRPSDFAAAVAVGDFDRNGCADLFVGRGAASGNVQLLPYANRLYLNNGYGAFADATKFPSIPAMTNDAAAVDVDGDGDLDVVTANEPHTYFQFLEGENHIYLNDGGGGFSLAPAANLPAHRDASAGVAVGDVDGNGTVDLFFANFAQDRLYLGDGKGKFKDAASQLPVLAESSSAAIFVDADGDRDLDVVVASRTRNRLLLNDGKGNFSDASQRLPHNNALSNAVAALDFDGDGDSDLVFATSGLTTGAQDTLYQNDGKGNFRIVSGLPNVASRAWSVAAADVDGDGHVDLVFGEDSGTGSRNRLLLGDGRGKFADGSSRLPKLGGVATDVVLADLDRDRDLEIVSVAHEVTVLTNRLRQVDAPYLLRLSIPFALDIYSHPGFASRVHTAIPFVSLAAQTPAIVIEPFGVWRLQVAGVVPLNPVLLKAPGGTKRILLRLPQIPQLVGGTLLVQGWTFDSTNVLTSRFTNAFFESIFR